MGRRGGDGVTVARSNVVVRQEEEEVDRATISRPKRRHASSPFFDNSHSPHSAITFRVRFSLSLSLSPVYIRSSTIVPCSSFIHHSTRLGRVFVSSFFPFFPFSFCEKRRGNELRQYHRGSPISTRLHEDCK